MIEGGAGSLAWHVDGFVRRTDDLKVPEYTPVADGEPMEPTDRVRNSESETQSGAIGASWVDPLGHAGISLDTYRNDYGVTVEPDVLIRMKRDRVAVSAERRQLGGIVDGVSLRLAGATRPPARPSVRCGRCRAAAGRSAAALRTPSAR